MGRRITAKLNNNTTTDLYFSAAWQVLEEDVGGTMQNQYVWSPLYVDALVEGDLGGTRYYAQQDANWNVTAIVSTTGVVQERFVYDPYGAPTFLDSTWLHPGTIGWSYLFQGGRYDSVSTLYNFRNRDLSPSLGRWMEHDPIGYAAGDTNDAAFYEKERQRCLAAAEAWRPERLGRRFEEFFTQVVHSSGRPHSARGGCG